MHKQLHSDTWSKKKEEKIMAYGKYLLNTALYECKQQRVFVDVYLKNGVKVPGCVMDFDESVVGIWSEGRQKIVFIDAISTIVPEHPLEAIKR